MTARDCAQHGHVWAEGERPKHRATHPILFARHSGRPAGKVAVYCLHCHATTELEGHGAFTRGGPASPKVGAAVPPQFMKVMDRALADATTHTGPARPQ